MNDGKSKVDATDLAHQISAYEENIARCEKNIIIFTDEVEKQRALKASLEEDLKHLKEGAEKAGTN